MMNLKECHDDVRAGKIDLQADIQELVIALTDSLEGYAYDVTANYVDIEFNGKHFLVRCSEYGYSFKDYSGMNRGQLLWLLAKFMCIKEKRAQ